MGRHLTRKQRLMKAFARFGAQFGKPRGRRRLMIADAPSIVPDCL